MSSERKSSDPVRRALDMLEVLCGELPAGLSNKDLATALQCPPPYVTRTAQALIDKGWVERMPDGRFRVTTRFSQLTFRVMRGFDKAAGQLDDLRRNYTLGH